MTPMTPAAVRAHVETLTHTERMQQLVALGALAVRQDSKGQGDATVAQTLSAFAEGDWFARLLALQSVYGSRDGAQALRALTDTSRTIRRRAVRLMAVVGDDRQIGPAFQALTHREDRRALARHLLRRGRQARVTQVLASLIGALASGAMPIGSSTSVGGSPSGTSAGVSSAEREASATQVKQDQIAMAPDAADAGASDASEATDIIGADWRDLLPYGAAPTGQTLAHVLATATRDEWAQWVRRHPVALAEAFLRTFPPTAPATAPTQGTPTSPASVEPPLATIGSARGVDTRRLWQVGALLSPLAEAAPDAAVRLLRQLSSQVGLSQLPLPGLQRVAERRPNEVADLVLASVDPVPLRFAAVVARLSPERVVALQARGALGRPETWLGRLPVAQRLRVVRAVAAQESVEGPNEGATEGADGGMAGWRDADGLLSPTVVGLLLGALRAAEARRALLHPALATRPLQRMPYAAFLPWPEAQSAVAPAIADPDPDLRIAGLTALLGAARYQRDALGAALTLVRQRGAEQDPVRRALIAALAALPPSRWCQDDLPALAAILRAALDAMDLSAATIAASEQLLGALAPFHPQWVAGWVAVLLRERGDLDVHAILGAEQVFGAPFGGSERWWRRPHRAQAGRGYRRAVAQTVAHQVVPVLRAWAAHGEHEETILAVCSAFAPWLQGALAGGATTRRLATHRRLVDLVDLVDLVAAVDDGGHALTLPLAAPDGASDARRERERATTPDEGTTHVEAGVSEAGVSEAGASEAQANAAMLIDLIEQIIARTTSSTLAAQALDLLLAVYPDRAAVLIPELVAADLSWITITPVAEYLHRRRQDLLTPFLGSTAYAGRFTTGERRVSLKLTAGFQRWTEPQQAMFAETLTRLVAEPDRDTFALRQALAQLVALPATPPVALATLEALAQGDAPRPAVRDRALYALAELDGGQGLPTLLAALADARARVAIYAVRRALRPLPPHQALTILRQVPFARVTVAKEVVRLIGDLPGDAAYDELLTIAARDDLPRDVRVALLRALWTHLDQQATWPILEQAAHDADPALAKGLLQIPSGALSRPAEQRVARLLTLLVRHPDPVVRVQALKRCVTQPVVDPDRTLWGALLGALEADLPDEATATASAVLAQALALALASGAVEVTALASDLDAAIRRLLPRLPSVSGAPTTSSAPRAPLLSGARRRQTLLALAHAVESHLPWERAQIVPFVRATLAALATDPLTSGLRLALATQTLPWEELPPLFVQAAATEGADEELHAEALLTVVAAFSMASRRPDAKAGLRVVEDALASSVDARLRRLALGALVASADAGTTMSARRMFGGSFGGSFGRGTDAAGAAVAWGWTAERVERLRTYQLDPAPLVASAAQFTFTPLQ